MTPRHGERGGRALLDGVTVLDLTRVLAGPICGRAMADLGARVIKVEPPAGDLSRFSQPRHGPVSGYFAQQNSGKENVSIDLDAPGGPELLFELACRVDVVLENFRPGVCARWGVGYEAVAARNPGVVYGSITGFGQTGPWAQRRAYAVVGQASAGTTAGWLDHLERVGGSVLANDAYSHGDVYSGLIALAGVLAALFARERTGVGQQIDVSMLDALLFVNEHASLHLDGTVEPGDPAALGSGWSPVVETADGAKVSVAGDPGGVAWAQFCAALGRGDLVDHPSMATWDGRRERADELRVAFAEFASTIPDAPALVSLLDEVGIAAAEVLTVAAVADSEHARHRGSITTVDTDAGGFRIPSPPWRFSTAPAAVAGPPAWRGQHNRAAVGDLLGLDGETLDALEADGVLVARPPRR